MMMHKVMILLPILFVISSAGRRHHGHGGHGALQGGHSNAWRKQDDHGNYAFNYDITDPLGAKNSRQEQGDRHGNKAGSYTIYDADGRQRVVDYVADKRGFRVKIRSNEPGVQSHMAADAFFHGGRHH